MRSWQKLQSEDPKQKKLFLYKPTDDKMAQHYYTMLKNVHKTQNNDRNDKT